MAWSPPIYNLSTQPHLTQSYTIHDDTNANENFARNVRWTPDGSAFMTHCENHTLQLFTTPPLPPSNHGHHTTPNTDTNSITHSTNHPFRPNLVLRQPAPILDFTWFPGATPIDPASFCFLASVRDCPVKLLDASDGRLRASYKIIDHRERFVAPHCMSFNLDASKIYCGHESSVEIFDMSYPGEGTRILTSPSRKSKDGLKGIVSALTFSPNYSTPSDAFYAIGTLNTAPSNLAIYTESQPDVPMMFIGGGERAGVTQLRFNPIQPHILYAAYRRRQAIYAWDLRSDINSPFAKYVIPDKPNTNQKMWFDLDSAGQRLAVGDRKGNVNIFDLTPSDDSTTTMTQDTLIKPPDLTVTDAHSDSVGSVAFHPYNPVLISVSGSRHYKGFEVEVEDESDTDEDTDDDDDGGDGGRVISKPPKMRPVTMDSSIKVWDFTGR